jgi:hypothetical protein
MGRRAKSLREHILDGTFRLDRHEHLLLTDDSLLNWQVDPDDPQTPALSRLVELQLAYRECCREDSPV